MKKRIHHVKSLTFWYSFLSFALISFLIAASIFSLQQHQSIQESKLRTQAENQQLVNALHADIDSILSGQIIAANRVRSLKWISQYYADNPILNDDFTFSKQRELSNMLQLYTNADQVEKRSFLIFPYRDTCVSSNVWVSIKDYFGMLRIVPAQQEQLLDEIRSVRRFSQLKLLSQSRSISAIPDGNAATPVIALCAPLEGTRQPRAYAIFLIDKSLLASRLASQLTGALCGVDITDASTGEVLLSISNNKPDGILDLQVRSSDYIDWDYHIYLNPAVYSIASATVYTHSLPTILLLFIICMLLAYGLAYLTYLPLGRLTAHMQGTEDGATLFRDYQVLGQHLNAIRLQQEEDRRLNTLRSLLTSPVGSMADELAQCGLPFTNSMWYQVYLISGEAQDHSWQESLAMEALAIDREYDRLSCTGLALDSGTYAILTACHTEEAANELDHDVQNRLSQRSETIYVGQPGAGFVGASIAYQSAQDSRAYSPEGGARYYFPLEWESQFITALRAGSEENALLICGNLRKENVRRRDAGQMDRSDMLLLLFTLHNDLQRVAAESGRQDMLPAGMMTFAGKRTREIWAEFERVCVMLCRKNTSPLSENSNDLTAQIIRYTQEHFSDPGLSLTTLEEAFSISSSTVNKCFKNADGSTFYAYLTRIRMEHACRMLVRGGISIAELARSCGYENEYSFRRTFQRTQGVKAQDYAAIQQNTAKETNE